MSFETTPLREQNATLRCADGATMRLDVVQPGDPAVRAPVVVICHGFKGFRTWGMFPHLARRLAVGGRAVATFDFSHNGIGDVDGEFTRLDLFREQTVSRAVEDLGFVLQALDDAREMPLSGLAPDGGFHVVGHSMGGGIGVLRAADDERIRSLGLLNAVSHFERVPPEGLALLEETGEVPIKNARTGQVMPLGRAWFDDLARIDVGAAARRVRVPTLVLAGVDDQTVLHLEAEALASWIGGAQLVDVEGGDHTFGAKHPWLGWTKPLELVVDELDAFLPHA
ncbi:MAG: alpha/beta fold hydrolase [Planctomycetes bacterium]|nr:alpha/beta fold hydrolase [Planctomycetota bacterium]